MFLGDKMAKKDRNIIKNNQTAESTEYKKLITIIGIITVVFLLFYLITSLLTKDNLDNIFKNDLEATEIQYDEIIIGTMFNKDGKYYVLLQEKNDPYQEIFDSYITTIRGGKDKIYTVDLTNALNKRYLSEENSYDENNFKVKGTLLLEIENHKIKKHYDTKDDIYNELKELAENVE